MTEQINNAQSSKWVVVFHGMEGIAFKTTNVTIPAVISGVTEVGGGDNVSLTLPGDHVVYDELSFDFLVDEDFLNYAELQEWLEGNTEANDPLVRDCSVHLTDTAGNFRGLRIDFTHAYPTTLSGFPLDSENAVPDIQSTVTVRFERMKFVRSTVETA